MTKIVLSIIFTVGTIFSGIVIIMLILTSYTDVHFSVLQVVYNIYTYFITVMNVTTDILLVLAFVNILRSKVDHEYMKQH